MAGKLKTLFGKGKELEGRVSRRVGALGGKAKKEGDDVYSVADKAAPGGRRRARGEKGAAKSGKANEVKDLTSSGRKRIGGAAGVAGICQRCLQIEHLLLEQCHSLQHCLVGVEVGPA